MSYFLNYIYRFMGQFDYYAIMIFVFMAFVFLILALVLMITKRDFRKKRISQLVNDPGGSKPNGKRPKLIQEEPSGVIARVANPLHALAAPRSEFGQKKNRLKLVRAGYRSKQAYRYYWATKVFLAIVAPLVYLLRSFFITINIQVLSLSILLGVVGFLIPNVILLHLVQKRQQGILRALPDALDMMVVCVEAGLGLDMTFKKVGDEIKSLSGDLSEELYLANLEVRAGKPRDESLRNLALRTGVPDIQNLVSLLVQTNRFGTSVAKALRVHADGMRLKRRQLAEAKAAKSVVALLFPLIFFIFPAFFVVVVGPAIIRIVRNLLPALGGH